MGNEILSLNVEAEKSGLRIDVYLNETIKDFSRSKIQKLIEENNIKVNNKYIKSNYKVRKEDIIEVMVPEPVKLNVLPEDIDIEIMYEDDDILVVNKPQGMVVHPAAGNYTGTLVNAILAKCDNLSGINGVIRPGIVHRIDKDTSGVLVIAKNDNSHKNLAEQIKIHSINRIYLAITEGLIKNDVGTIDIPIGRHPTERKKMSVLCKNGRNAITHYKVLERFKENTLLEVKLETGRTHQIRVHMSYIGHPLVGDPVYGFKKQKYKLKGQALHARMLGFVHPSTGKYMEFSAEPPEYFIKLVENLRKTVE